MIVPPDEVSRLTKFWIVSRCKTQIAFHIPVTMHNGSDSVTIPAGGRLDALKHENVDMHRLNDMPVLKRLRDMNKVWVVTSVAPVAD